MNPVAARLAASIAASLLVGATKNPSSIASAPAPAAASTNAGVSAGRGYPTVRYAISARRPSPRSRANIGAIRLTRSCSHPGGGVPDDIQVFVATPREVDQDDVVGT